MDYWPLLGDGWKLEEMYSEGAHIFTKIVKGTEIHVEPHGSRRILRSTFQAAFGPIIDEYGYATTRVPHGFDDRFTRRIGFEETWRDEQFVYFILDHVPFVRSK